MNKIINNFIHSYKNDVQNYGFSVTEQHVYLQIGTIHSQNIPRLYVSVITVAIADLLKMILPLLKESAVPFLLIKNDKCNYMLNAGNYGEDEIGKVLIICPRTVQEAIYLIKQVNLATSNFSGPICPSANRIGRILYIERSPTIKGLAQSADARYIQAKKRRVIIGQCYVPIAIVKTSFKGTVYKAVSLKKLSFQTCLIKEGKPQALDDHLGRSVRDRLLWQKEVTIDLQDQAVTPAFYSYFEEHEHSYLVTQFIEGVTLFETVRAIYQGKSWSWINKTQKTSLLNLFLQALEIVKSIHQKGYVQRDISDSNFLVMSNGNLCIIDFELSYHMISHKPAPPFPLGTVGYAAPEQLELADPDYKEDIYALGALLCFMLTGIPPVHFISKNRAKLFKDLNGITKNSAFNKLTIRCLSLSRSERPDINTIQQGINDFMQTIV